MPGTAFNFYGGNLYCYNGTNFINLNVDNNPVGNGNWSGIRAMYSSSYGYLQLGDIYFTTFAHYDGTNFYFDADFGNFGTGVADFAEYNNMLYAAGNNNLNSQSENIADLFSSTDGINWSVVPSYGSPYALWGLQPFQGQLYLGYDNGQLACMDSSETYYSVLAVSDSIISMAAAGDSVLYFGTGVEAVGSSSGSGPGYVYAYSGKGATNATLISNPMGVGVQCLDSRTRPTRPFANHTGNRFYLRRTGWRALQHNERDFLFDQHRDEFTNVVARQHSNLARCFAWRRHTDKWRTCGHRERESEFHSKQPADGNLQRNCMVYQSERQCWAKPRVHLGCNWCPDYCHTKGDPRLAHVCRIGHRLCS